MNLSTYSYPSVHFEDDGRSGSFTEGQLTTSAGGNDDQNTTDTDTLVSKHTTFIIQLIVSIVLSAGISMFGVVANIINITVFIRQGIFTDSGSTSLFGLAVSDLWCSITTLWLSIIFTVMHVDPPGLSWNPWDIAYLTAIVPQSVCGQITRVVTAFVAFERCVCVVFPFKVKTLFTPKRTLLIIGVLFVCGGMPWSPIFIMQQLSVRMDPDTNTTRTVLIRTQRARDVQRIVFYVNSLGISVGSVTIVFLCTMITVSRVKLSKAWRQSVATGPSTQPETPQQNPELKSSEKPDYENADPKRGGKPEPAMKTSNTKMKKETKLIRVIISISVISLICYVPEMTYLIVSSIESNIRVGGKYQNMLDVMYSFIFLMVTANSSMNIFVYYKMSSRYKQELHRMCAWKEV